MICIKNTETNDSNARNVQVKGSEREITDDLVAILKLFSENPRLRNLLAAATYIAQSLMIEKRQDDLIEAVKARIKKAGGGE